MPSSKELMSTPSKVTLGNGAPVRAARVGSRSRELASSWVTPVDRWLFGHSDTIKAVEMGSRVYKKRARGLTRLNVAWPEGQGRFSDTTFISCSFPTSQEARAATSGHTHQLGTRTNKEVISNEGPRALTHHW